MSKSIARWTAQSIAAKRNPASKQSVTLKLSERGFQDIADGLFAVHQPRR